MTASVKLNPLFKIFNSGLVQLPSPSSLTLWWNFGSLLGITLGVQIITGIFLAIHYARDLIVAFQRVSHISRDVALGWLIRIIHANGASLFFVCLYLHLARNLYFGSFRKAQTWTTGVLLLILTIATAFFGYVLPWGQMSFWGATVITNLFSAIPSLGPELVVWVWGGFAVDQPTLTRFFAFHFLTPFLISGTVLTHFLFLHEAGSSNPLGLRLNQDKIPFHPYYSSKDLIGVLITFLALGILVFLDPWLLGDPENFIPANPLVTPLHIQPEWYFLFAYAILRSVPNKLGGVAALMFSILVLFFIPLIREFKIKGLTYYPINKRLFWAAASNFFLLTWIGARPVEVPYIITGQILTIIYFIYFFTINFVSKIWDSLLG